MLNAVISLFARLSQEQQEEPGLQHQVHFFEYLQCSGHCSSPKEPGMSHSSHGDRWLTKKEGCAVSEGKQGRSRVRQ